MDNKEILKKIVELKTIVPQTQDIKLKIQKLQQQIDNEKIL